MFILINAALFALSAIGVLTVYILYPLILLIAYLTETGKEPALATSRPSVSILVVARKSEGLIKDTIDNLLDLNYPQEHLEIIVISEESADNTEETIKSFDNKRVRFFPSKRHQSQASAVNEAVRHCSGEIVIFSDAKARLSPDAVTKLVRHYSDPQVGGVCGQEIIYRDQAQLKKSQEGSVKFGRAVMLLESGIGSVTSNSNGLYSIRRELWQPLEPSAEEGLYSCLSIVKQGRRFIFDREAGAYLQAPPRNPGRELAERRRIVCRSLESVRLMRELLNPAKYRLFSVGLLVKQVIRHLLPIFLILLLFTSFVLSLYSDVFLVILIPQILFYLLAMSYSEVKKPPKSQSRLRRTISLAFYFCLENFGTLMGLIDFLKGRKITEWEPVKPDD